MILLTHGHGDHLGDTVDIAKRTGATVVAIVELADEIAEAGVENVMDPNFGGTVAFDWGWVKLVPAWHTAVSPSGTAHMPAGLLIHIGDQLVYHLGDTCLFSDMKLIARRGDKVDLALVPIGGHYTMDRYDAVTAVEFIDPAEVIPCHYDTFPPIETDAEAFKSDVQNAASRGRRARARRHPHGQMTHAIVLIQADRTAIKTLGGALADVEGVAEAYSVTGEWDFVAMLRVRTPAEVAEVVTQRFAALEGIKRTQTLVAFEVFSQHDLEALCSVGNSAWSRPEGWSCQPRANQSGRSFQSCAISRLPAATASAPMPASSAPVAPWWQRCPRIQSRLQRRGRSGVACG